MDNYQEALKAFCGALARESGGGGNSLETIEPQDIAGAALFLRDGRVALFGGGEGALSVASGDSSPKGGATGGAGL